MREFDIGELAELAGLQSSALRYYEREGLLQPSGRSGGRRVYNEHGLLQLAAVDFWQEAGFTIKEIARLVTDPTGDMAQAKRMAADRVAELDRFIDEATRVKESLAHILGCLHEQLSDCPHYHRHLRDRADEYAGGTYRRDRRLRLHKGPAGNPTGPKSDAGP